MKFAHHALTRLAVWLGPGSLPVQFALRRACHPARLSFHSSHIDIRREQRFIRIAANRFPYAVDLAHSFDSYFSQVMPEPTKDGLLVDYSGSKLQTYSNGLEFEIASIPEEIEAIQSYFDWYRPKPSDTIFDIGAYCGVSAYHFAKAVPKGNVVAFEPDPVNYSFLLRNIDRHHLTNVMPVHAAIAGRSELAEFSSEGTMGSVLKRQLSRPTLGRLEKVRTCSFEDACNQYGIPEFAKVDIEGSEIEMLASAQQFLSQHPIQFVLDTNHWVNGTLTNSAVEKIFVAVGYQVRSSAKFGGMTTWARVTSAANLSGPQQSSYS